MANKAKKDIFPMFDRIKTMARVKWRKIWIWVLLIGAAYFLAKQIVL